ncbi:lytic transglycosylase domain-containing protein [Actinoallomurus sp. CA-150999]|uniref:aggregation-promoting factor C-terminal-like domain-containing protein n=1 Tax=Actinoallomurus sp. CA-150999 TaxID=3239887 RepID=UPI003D8D6A72
MAETAREDEFEATRHDFGAPPPGGPPPTPSGSGDDEFESMRRNSRSSNKLLKIGAIAAAAAVVVGGGTAAFALTGGGGSKPTAKAADPSTSVQTQAQQPAPLTDAQRKNIESQRQKVLKQRALRAARDENDRPKLLAKGEPIPTKTPTTDPGSGGGGGGGGAGDPVPAGEAQKIARSMLSSFGWSPSSQFGCLVNLWNRESGWNTHAANPSGAYGIPQALPGSKMASAGSDWQNNATTQIKWGLGYIKSRYSTPCGAWGHSQSTGWY